MPAAAFARLASLSHHRAERHQVAGGVIEHLRRQFLGAFDAGRPPLAEEFARVYGGAYRLRCTTQAAPDGDANLLDDPVINYAARTFGGQPKRVAGEES